MRVVPVNNRGKTGNEHRQDFQKFSQILRVISIHITKIIYVMLFCEKSMTCQKN